MSGVRTGLDYSAVWTVLDRLKVRRPREVFEQLQTMEFVALEVWGEQVEAEQQRATRK